MKTSKLGAILYLGAALPFFGCARPEPAARPAPEKAASRSQVAAKPTLEFETTTRGWETEKRYGYRLKMTTSLAFAGGPPSFDFDVSGKLEIVSASVSDELVTLYLALSEPKVENRVTSSKSELERFVTEVQRSGAFVTLSGGRVTAVQVPPGMSDMAMSTYRQLGAALQFARAKGGPTSYTAEEYDTTGKYVAEYAISPGGEAWTKRKRSYLDLLGAASLPGNAGLHILPEVFASRGEVRLSSDGRPVSVKSEDEIGLSGTQAPLRSKLSLELTATDVRPEPARDFAQLLGETRRIAASEPLRGVTPLPSLDDARIGKLDFETIVAELENAAKSAPRANDRQPGGDIQIAAPTSESEVQANSRRFVALAAIFRKDPKAVNKAVAKIRAKSPATDDLLDTLSSASTPEAQQALVSLIGVKGIDKDFRARLVFSLARAQKPTREASQALKSVLADDEFNAGALYGLGTHCRLYRDAGRTEDAREVGEFLLARLGRATEPSTLATVLRALANSGYDGALPAVTKQLKDKSEQVRTAALRALQSMRDARVDPLLARYLTEDESHQVRLSAIESMALREPNEAAVAALERAVIHDEDPHVRYRSVELLAEWLPRRPEVRGALEEVANNDEEEKVRSRAKAVL